MAGLVADIGGTNARFGLFDGGLLDGGMDTPIALDHIEELHAKDFATLADAARHYLDHLPSGKRPRVGTLAVAAPAVEDRIALTNRDWSFSTSALRTALGFDQLFVINDFTAVSLSLLKLPAGSWVEIGPSRDLAHARTVGVIGPGSGLGVGGLLSVDGHHVPLASEGGHMDFAPLTEIEWKIAQHLTARFGRVSNERLLSGPGLENIFQALHRIAGSAPPPLDAADIANRGVSGEDPRCRETLDLFCAILGGAAGNLALLLYADAIFIAGGIVPRFVEFLRQSSFRARFETKGRFGAYLVKVPTMVITEKYPGLIGAAVHLLQSRA